MFQEAKMDTPYEQTVRGLLTFRTEGPTFVYWTSKDTEEEILVGYGTEPFEIEMPPGDFIVKSETRVWIGQSAVQQFTESTSDDIFTTLDRPAPMSPEMMAISRMIRRNEIERETMREMVEDAQRTFAELQRNEARGTDSVVLEENTTEQTTASAGNKGRKKATSKSGNAENATAENDEDNGDGNPGGNANTED